MSNVKKRCQVIMLPTKKAENSIVISRGKAWYFKGYFTQEYLQSQNKQSNHLYITSDEEIKEGDWVGYPNLKNWIPVQYLGGDLTSSERKIIATTDKSILKDFNEGGDGGCEYFPQPSPEFIDKFVEAYNLGKPITEVMVEYESVQTTKKEDYKYFGNHQSNLNYVTQLKVNKANEISISRVKDSWTREEITELFEKFVDQKYPLLYPFLKENL